METGKTLIAPMHPNPFYDDFLALSRYSDAGVQFLVKRVGAPGQKLPASRSLDEAVLSIVIGQMLSNKAAASIKAKLLERFGSVENVFAALLELPKPAPVFGLSTSKVRSLRHWIGCERRKLGLPATLHRADLETLFTGLPGFGPWSRDMLAIFHLTLPDVWPTGDLIVRRAGEALWNGSHPPVQPEHFTVLALMSWEAIHLGVDVTEFSA
jgi:3-methyladenine DNA glycosylase/8-oxoguanine DNA glycosylase